MEEFYTRFYVCKKCDAVVGLIHGDNNCSCCESLMTKLEPIKIGSNNIFNVEKTSDKVKIFLLSCEKPKWIYLQTERGGQRKKVSETDGEVEFSLISDKGERVYLFFNSLLLYEFYLNI